MQELYRWDIVAEAARKALSLRYRLLSHMHTLFKEASETGAPVARPLWFEYPLDTQTHRIDRQWLLGSDILVAPVLEEVPLS
jgi:alpha-glucosidase (family GH31 glycosyl hydrolase)